MLQCLTVVHYVLLRYMRLMATDWYEVINDIWFSIACILMHLLNLSHFTAWDTFITAIRYFIKLALVRFIFHVFTRWFANCIF